jgi:oligo-1,6-glucosidase
MLLGDDEQLYAFTRQLDDAEMLVLVNLSGSTADPGPLEGWHDAQPLVGTVPGDPSRTMLAWEYRVLRRAVVSG